MSKRKPKTIKGRPWFAERVSAYERWRRLQEPGQSYLPRRSAPGAYTREAF